MSHSIDMPYGIRHIVFRETTIIEIYSVWVLGKKRATLRITTWSPTVVIADPGNDSLH